MVFAYELVINFLYFTIMDTPVRKHKSFSAQEKLYALDQLKKGKQTQLARDLGISESTLQGWKKEEKLHSLPCILEAETGLQGKKVKFANDESLDSALYQWFVQACSEGVPISGPILKAQAEKFDRLINGNESKFKASNGWLDRFKKRHTISQVLVSGEIHSADKEAADSYPIELKKALSRGRTESLLFCVNKSDSHKVRPLMMGKARSPRCFHHVNMKALPFEYTNSKNLFGLICKNSSRRKNLSSCWIIALPTPPAEDLVSHDGKIKVSYLPKNTTSEIQPLDQGIILVFKQNYRHEMIKRMVADNNSSVNTSLASLNLKEVCRFSGKAWDAISAHCIEQCWIKGLGPAFLSSTHDDGNDDEPEFTRFIEDDVHDKMVANVSRKNEAAPPEPEPSGANDDDNDGTSTPPPKVSEAVKHLEAILRWLETQDVDSVKLLQLRSILDFARSQQSVANKGNAHLSHTHTHTHTHTHGCLPCCLPSLHLCCLVECEATLTTMC
uniref:HTH CENPB-type domain-containing protein n=1 Tax=Chrysemys picta bellii TaxID=8478 RepID=A0A8C3IN05_CHRPI